MASATENTKYSIDSNDVSNKLLGWFTASLLSHTLTLTLLGPYLVRYKKHDCISTQKPMSQNYLAAEMKYNHWLQTLQ